MTKKKHCKTISVTPVAAQVNAFVFNKNDLLAFKDELLFSITSLQRSAPWGVSFKGNHDL